MTMKLALTGLMIVAAIAPTQFALAQESQPPAVPSQPPVAPPQQNDSRAAIGRINPQKPVQIRVISGMTVPVVASLVALTDDRPIAPGQSVIFGRLHTSYLPLPMNLQVSLQETPDPAKPTKMFVDVKTSGNEIIVNVTTALTGSGNASQAINVNEKGAIYLY
jgi:hypothetical protein